MKPASAAALVGAAAAVLVAAAWLLPSGTQETEAAPAVEAPVSAPQLGPLPAAPVMPATAAPVRLTPEDHAFLRDLRTRFAGRLKDKHAQIKAIEQLVAYLQQRYPDDWRERVRAFLDLLTPELAEGLWARFEGLQRLNEWLATHREALMRLPPAERRAALWTARREAFGADAEEIYAGERRNEQVADALDSVAATDGRSTDEKLDQFLAAVSQAYGDQAQNFIQSRQTELVNRFLEVPSIRDELARQSAAERGATLRAIRSGLGMDEEALGRWDALDGQRDAAWEAGTRYLQERERILTSYSGEARARELARLQDRQFGDEADTIRAEEAAGFHRYGHSRRYGRE